LKEMKLRQQNWMKQRQQSLMAAAAAGSGVCSCVSVFNLHQCFVSKICYWSETRPRAGGSKKLGRMAWSDVA